MIFSKTGHALHLRFYRTKMEPGMFRRGAAAELCPEMFDMVLIEFGDFTQGDVNVLDTPGVMDLQK
jgi:hypothetical protein